VATARCAAAPQKPGGSVITVCGNVIVDGMCGKWWWWCGASAGGGASEGAGPLSSGGPSCSGDEDGGGGGGGVVDGGGVVVGDGEGVDDRVCEVDGVVVVVPPWTPCESSISP
jgi:hypothetical protein